MSLDQGAQADFWRFVEKTCSLTNVAAVFANGESLSKLEMAIKSYSLGDRCLWLRRLGDRCHWRDGVRGHRCQRCAS